MSRESDLQCPGGVEPADGAAWRLVTTRLSKTQGITYSDTVDPLVANLIVRCDGEKKLRDVLGELAPPNADLGAFAAPHLQALRRLIAAGVLLPGEAPRLVQ